ncbi:hypothetical protein MMC14_009289 [Varicellaria rhodocarpa]|nr:hypothetical protein [Varicellaria rhodocarpa]
MWPGQSEMENEAENKTIPTPPTPSKITSAVLMRDERCHMTSCVSYLESAHLCPRSESEWFESQQMAQYNLDFELSNGVDDTSNRIALRKDIHAAFDRNDFVFTRKHDSWAIHFLKLTPEWGPIYHNTPVKFAQGISHTSLLTRFAFSIFPLVKGFLLSTLKDRPRAILVRTNGQADPSEKNLEYPAIQGLLTETQKQHGRTKRRKEGDDVLEPVEAESRRMADVRRTSSVPDTSNYSRTFTPIGTSPATSVQPDANRWCPPRFEHIKDVEARHFAILRSTERRKRRPAPEQMCCDYNAAEEAGSELCSRCLGWEGEYEEDRFEEDGFEVYD